MQAIQFDVSDITQFSEKNYRVTGIQRVQLRLIADIVKATGNRQVRGLAFLGRQQGWRSIDLAFLATQQEFNATRFLIHTGKLQPSRFPARNQVRQYLAPFNDQKKARALKKAWIYLQALVAPTALTRRTGLTLYRRPDPTVHPSHSVSELPPGSVLAILGGNWDVSETETLARRHRETGGRVALLVYDLVAHTNPELQTESICSVFNAWLERTPDYVSDYICISEHTAQEMRKFLARRNVQARVVAMPLAHEFPQYPRDHRPTPGVLARIRQAVPGRFVLCVGSIEVRKNGVALLKAWQKVRDTLGADTPTLVFAGKIAWKSDEFLTLLRDTGNLQGTACIFESPSDEELAALYTECLFTTYPSLIEGWGLPVGESAWFGKLTVASRATSIPEVCGPLVDYVDPTDVDDIARQLLRPLLDPAYLPPREQALRQANLRTWTQVSERMHQLLLGDAPATDIPRSP